MKFYYSTETCSLVTHIILQELGASFTPVEVSWSRDLNVKELEKLNPWGSVPTLQTDQGIVITQNIAILEYLADQNPQKELLAKPGSVERAQTMSWLAYAAADFHKSFSPIFQAEKYSDDEDTQNRIKEIGVKGVRDHLDYLNQSLEAKDFITGHRFTIADAYLFVILGWCEWAQINIAEYKNVKSYYGRVWERPAVQKALKAEGSI